MTRLTVFSVVEMPPDPEPRSSRGSESTEKLTQEQREQTALGAVYMTPNQIPESPAEPSTVITEEEVDRDVTTMTTGPEVDAIFWSGEPAPVVASVADLVGQLAMGNMMDPSMIAPNTQGLDLTAIVQNLPQEHLQQLLQQLSVPTPFGQVSQYGGDESWLSAPSQSSAEYGQTYHEDSDHMRWSSESRGRGRGRGRGKGGRGEDYRHIKRKPCSFFAAGRRALNLKLIVR
jgi:protein phosphatase 1 regulatory subunit 10